MNISDYVTQERLQEILQNIYTKGNESKDINVKEVIDDIKQHFLLLTEEKNVNN